MKTNLEDQLFNEMMKESNGNISFVARQLGLNYQAVREEQRRKAEITFQRVTEPEPGDIRVLGKKGLEYYVIAVKPRGQAWPTKYNAIIADARRKFDAGTHDMYQTNNGGWCVQYLIPLLHSRKPCKFFSSMVNMT